MTGLDAREAAGRLVLPALRLDTDADAEVRRDASRALEEGVGGFVLFGGEAGQVRRLTRDLRAAAGRPLWMASDLERGAGQQFEGAVACPPPAALARAPAPEEAARLAGRITGEEARRVGVDWVFAPVLDLDVEPENPIVSTRSFGADPERVARLGAAWIEGCQSAGVAACAKHYPGHGRTTADSHLELPVVDATAGALEREDLAPFRAAAPEVASVMTAHVAYPALDPGEDGSPPPATYSRAIVERLLRGEMDFGGMVVTDALVMAGAGGSTEGERPGPGALAARALRAGCDLLLYPDDVAAAVEGLAERVEGGPTGSAPALGDRVRSALERIRDVRTRFVADGGAGAGERTGGDAGLPEERAREALRLASSCMTAVDAGGRPPGSGLNPEEPVELVALSDDLERPGEAEFGRAFLEDLRERGWRAEVAAKLPDRKAGAGQRVVLLRSTPQADKGRALPPEDVLDSVRVLADRVEEAALVVFGHERALRAVGRPGLCAWATEDVMQRAAARRLDAAARGA